MPIEPGQVLELDQDQLQSLLEAGNHQAARGGNVVQVHQPESALNKSTITVLDEAIFAHAEAVTRRFFGDKVYQRGA